eukprot:scaffold2383_cov161-Amphora_coffeaeformis.AAC.35
MVLYCGDFFAVEIVNRKRTASGDNYNLVQNERSRKKSKIRQIAGTTPPFKFYAKLGANQRKCCSIMRQSGVNIFGGCCSTAVESPYALLSNRDTKSGLEE